MNSIILLGDTTSHGGTVISCSTLVNSHDKGWVRVGDMVTCPQCRGVFPFNQGNPAMLDEDKPVAYEGCKTACGAELKRSQQHTLTEPLKGAARRNVNNTVGSLPPGFGPVSTETAAGYQEELANLERTGYRGRFRRHPVYAVYQETAALECP